MSGFLERLHNAAGDVEAAIELGEASFSEERALRGAVATLRGVVRMRQDAADREATDYRMRQTPAGDRE